MQDTTHEAGRSRADRYCRDTGTRRRSNGDAARSADGTGSARSDCDLGWGNGGIERVRGGDGVERGAEDSENVGIGDERGGGEGLGETQKVGRCEGQERAVERE